MKGRAHVAIDDREPVGADGDRLTARMARQQRPGGGVPAPTSMTTLVGVTESPSAAGGLLLRVRGADPAGVDGDQLRHRVGQLAAGVAAR